MRNKSRVLNSIPALVMAEKNYKNVKKPTKCCICKKSIIKKMSK